MPGRLSPYMLADGEIPYVSVEDNPLRAVQNAVALSPVDWSQDRSMAWVYAIVVGWDDPATDELSRLYGGGGVMAELAAQHGWDDLMVQRLRKLHRAYVRHMEATS